MASEITPTNLAQILDPEKVWEATEIGMGVGPVTVGKPLAPSPPVTPVVDVVVVVPFKPPPEEPIVLVVWVGGVPVVVIDPEIAPDDEPPDVVGLDVVVEVEVDVEVGVDVLVLVVKGPQYIE